MTFTLIQADRVRYEIPSTIVGARAITRGALHGPIGRWTVIDNEADQVPGYDSGDLLTRATWEEAEALVGELDSGSVVTPVWFRVIGTTPQGGIITPEALRKSRGLDPATLARKRLSAYVLAAWPLTGQSGRGQLDAERIHQAWSNPEADQPESLSLLDLAVLLDLDLTRERPLD